MEAYRIECCRSKEGCPKAVIQPNELIEKIRCLLQETDFSQRRKQQFPNGVKQHNILKITLAGCANSCSQPQIKDFSLIAKRVPHFNQEKCNSCGLCVKSCKEKCLKIVDNLLFFNEKNCLGCGDCMNVCSSNAVSAKKSAWRLLLGGKLGRNPQLAFEIRGVSPEEALQSLNKVIEIVLNAQDPNERFGDLLKRGLISDFL